MVIVYYYNTWDDSNTHMRIERVRDDCEMFEIHAAMRDYLALNGISVREWALEEISHLDDGGLDDMLKHGEKLIREQND